MRKESLESTRKEGERGALCAVIARMLLRLIRLL